MLRNGNCTLGVVVVSGLRDPIMYESVSSAWRLLEVKGIVIIDTTAISSD